MTFYSFFKRIGDFIFSLILLVFTSPFILISSFILFLELKEFPVLIQERGLTLEKKRIKILKLKTLPTERVIRRKHSRKNIFMKPSLAKDVPSFAKWLRKTGLDELPQLLNILLGQMSFIGPRPLMLSDLMVMKKNFPNHYEERQKFNSKPGLSGMWQIFGNREEGINNLIALEYLYEQSKTLLLDLRLALLTIPIVLQAQNSDAILLNGKLHDKRKYVNFDLSFGFKLQLKRSIFEPQADRNLSFTKTKDYTVDLPLDWWYTNNSYRLVDKSGKETKIIELSKYRREKFGKSA